MKSNLKFYICRHCGNLAELVKSSGVNMVCCGDKMTELKPNTAEASVEKHLPVITASAVGITVQVGSVPHPMTDEHNIAFVYAETARGGQRKSLKTGEEPKVSFGFSDDKPVAVYAYCNLHGLWKTEIK